MTNKEYFLKVMEAETPVFLKVIKAIPEDKADYSPSEKVRTARQLAHQLAYQPVFILSVAAKGVPEFSGGYSDKEKKSIAEIAAIAEKNYEELKANLPAVLDTDWESGRAVLDYGKGKWETERYDMVWGFLFDAIHHRGQLTAYLRGMGASVPSVYGGSADEPMGS